MSRRVERWRGCAIASLAVLAGCKSNDVVCGEVDCAMVDQSAEPSDDAFDILDPLSVIDLSPEGDAQPSEVAVVGGEVVMGPPSCPTAGIEEGCTRTLKRLRIAIDRFRVGLDVAPEIDVEHALVSIEAPLSISSAASGDYVVPTGTRVHTCATIDGKGWHDTRALDGPLFVAPPAGGKVYVDGGFLLALRASNAQCSSFALRGNVLAGYGKLSPGSDAGRE